MADEKTGFSIQEKIHRVGDELLTSEQLKLHLEKEVPKPASRTG